MRKLASSFLLSTLVGAAVAACSGTLTTRPADTPGPSTRLAPSSPTPSQAKSSATPTAATPPPPPTWTPLPTLSPSEAILRVDSLLTPGTSCLIPCWWGLTVGETTWAEAQQSVAPYASEILPWHSATIEEADGPHTIADYYVYYPVRGQRDNRGGMRITTRDSILLMIFVNRDSTSKGLSMSDVLRRYGRPSAALIRTFHDQTPVGLPFLIVLLYEDRRFIATYEIEGERVGQNVVGCPGESPPQITIWGPHWQWSPDEIQTYLLGPDYGHPLVPLQEASDSTSETLYEASEAGDQSLCIRTPASLW